MWFQIFKPRHCMSFVLQIFRASILQNVWSQLFLNFEAKTRGTLYLSHQFLKNKFSVWFMFNMTKNNMIFDVVYMTYMHQQKARSLIYPPLLFWKLLSILYACSFEFSCYTFGNKLTSPLSLLEKVVDESSFVIGFKTMFLT